MGDTDKKARRKKASLYQKFKKISLK